MGLPQVQPWWQPVAACGRAPQRQLWHRAPPRPICGRCDLWHPAHVRPCGTCAPPAPRWARPAATPDPGRPLTLWQVRQPAPRWARPICDPRPRAPQWLWQVRPSATPTLWQDRPCGRLALWLDWNLRLVATLHLCGGRTVAHVTKCTRCYLCNVARVGSCRGRRGAENLGRPRRVLPISRAG